MVDDARARAVRRRALALGAGDTARLFGLAVLVVVLGANLRALLVPRVGWWVVVAVVVVPLLSASRRGRAGWSGRTRADRPQYLAPAVTGPRRLVRVGRRGRLVLVDTVEPALTTATAGRGAGASGPARTARRVLTLALDRGVRPPVVRRWPGPVVNAYSLGSGRRAVLHVGDATVDALDGDALDAVILHELHHLRLAARVRAGAWLVMTSVATASLVLAAAVLVVISVLAVARGYGWLVLVALAGPGHLRKLLRFEPTPPILLLRWPTRLQIAADHRRDLLADLAAAGVVGPAAVERSLGLLQGALPTPAEVDAARVSGEPGGVALHSGRRCTVPVLGQRAASRDLSPTSLERRRQALAALVDGRGEGRARGWSTARRR